ncbi:hypothetical protein [Syntrophomonas erecta]
MPLNNRIGRPIEEDPITAMAKGKTKGSFANALFGATDDFFYEFGVIGPPKRQPKSTEKDEQP